MSSFYDFQGMEKKIRDQVGVQDFVLLEDYTNEESFLANLQKRAEADQIYVSTYIVGGYCWMDIELIKFLPRRPTLAKF